MLEQNYLDNTPIDLCTRSKLLDDKSWNEADEVVVKSIYCVSRRGKPHQFTQPHYI